MEKPKAEKASADPHDSDTEVEDASLIQAPSKRPADAGEAAGEESASSRGRGRGHGRGRGRGA